jgi:hypothetical protein
MRHPVTHKEKFIMKKLLSVFILATFAFGFLTIVSQPIGAQDSIYTQSGSKGFQAVATQSLTIATATASIIGTMPPSCREITVIASGANICYGDSAVTTTGLYPYIADGSSHTFEDISTRNPSIYFRAIATATGKIGILAK